MKSFHRADLAVLGVIAFAVVSYFCGWFTP